LRSEQTALRRQRYGDPCPRLMAEKAKLARMPHVDKSGPSKRLSAFAWLAAGLVREGSENETRVMRLRPVLADDLVTLEPADPTNVTLLIRWSLDPIAQGPFKRVPNLSTDELRSLFLADPDPSYFVPLQRSSDATPLGRFYWRAWWFRRPTDELVDWELNIFLADPRERGNGYGTAAQRLAATYLEARPETRSVFAFTLANNNAERRALLKAGFLDRGLMPHEGYPVVLPTEPCQLFVWPPRHGGTPLHALPGHQG